MKFAQAKQSASLIVVGTALLLGSAGLAVAQSEYPSGFGIRSGVGAYGQFDLNPKESQTIVELDESAPYRVCIVGKSSTIIVDDTKKNTLDQGDCYDVQGKKIVVQSDDTAGDVHGVYERLVPNARVNR
jgi:hypothetical protein